MGIIRLMKKYPDAIIGYTGSGVSVGIAIDSAIQGNYELAFFCGYISIISALLGECSRSLDSKRYRRLDEQNRNMDLEIMDY